MTHATCPNCQAPTLPEAAFCPFCGTRIEQAPAPAADRTPDVLGEVIAWRAWRVVGPSRRPLLGSVTHTETLWMPTDWTYATCPRGCGDNVPGEVCTCGLYAAKTSEQLVNLGYAEYNEHAPRIIGEVGLAGKVIEGTQGWRAQKGRIVRLHLPYEFWNLGDALKRLYRCDIALRNTWDAEGSALAVDPLALRRAREHNA